MIQNKGLNSRLNFDYTKAELLAILTNDSILKIRQELKKIEAVERTKR
jgi:hypothetical protein